MFSQFQGSKANQANIRKKIIEEDLRSAFGFLFQKHNQKIDERQMSELLICVEQLLIQRKILIPDVCTQEDSEILNERLTERKKELIGIWESRNDTEEGRKILGLCGVKNALLHPEFSSILIDDLKEFKKCCEYKRAEQWWKDMLVISCLIGSSQIGTFILEDKGDKLEALEKDDYEELLAYVALSSNEEWACAFAGKMRKMGYQFPNNLYNYDGISLESLVKIQEAFTAIEPITTRCS